jgi:hypothetical protein
MKKTTHIIRLVIAVVAVCSFGSLFPINAWTQTVHKSSSTTGNNLWLQVKTSLEKTTAYLKAYGEDINQDHSLKSILIRSNLYLDYAHIDQFAAQDPTQASIDLQQCQYFAKHALHNAQTYWTDNIIKSQIKDVVEEINQLRRVPGLAKQQARYTQIQQHMERVISVL